MNPFEAVTKVYEEGLQIPIMKLCPRGELDPTLERTIRANVRVPDQVLGGIQAQLAANATGGGRLLELMPLAEAMHARAEAAMRAAMAQIPDGAYRHVVKTDGFDVPIELHCTVRVQGGEMCVDYAGTSPQTERGINRVMNHTYAYSLPAVKCLTNPLIPNNEGGFRPVRFEEKSSPPDSGGAGRFRGGCGQRVVFSFLAGEPTAVAARMGRVQFPPQGYHGGLPGATGLILPNECTPPIPGARFLSGKATACTSTRPAAVACSHRTAATRSTSSKTCAMASSAARRRSSSIACPSKKTAGR